MVNSVESFCESYKYTDHVISFIKKTSYTIQKFD